jgi:hypothetical protein
MTDLINLLLALGAGTEPASSAQELAQDLAQALDAKTASIATDGEEHTSSPEESAEWENTPEPAGTAERLADTLDSLTAAKRSARQLEEAAATERTGQELEAAVSGWLTAAQTGTDQFGTNFSPVQQVVSGGADPISPTLAGTGNVSAFQQSAGAPPLEQVVIREHPSGSGLSLSALDRMMERDARRYDNGFPLY